jgi:putative Mg2+ transporter-C (MgtC) family protein
MNPLTLVNLSLAGALGTLIGIERQWNQGEAGLRTNALVAFGAASFAALHIDQALALIVSGIGFLGAGVIMRDGLNVRGLNTAATLWCAAAVGALAGAGLFETAAVGTAVVLAANIVLRRMGRAVDRRPQAGEEVTSYYTFLAVAKDEAEAHVRALLVQSLGRTDFQLLSISSTNSAGEGYVEVRAELVADNRDDKQMELAVSRLSLEPQVTSVRWDVRTEQNDPAPKNNGWLTARTRAAATTHEEH